MWWSLLKNAWNFFWPERDSQEERKKLRWEEHEEEILKRIDEYKKQNEDPELDRCPYLLGGSNQPGPTLETETYLCKIGRITFMCNDYGLIDDKFYFDIDCISPNIKPVKNDRISYVTASVPSNTDVTEKILKVCALSDVYWDTFDSHIRFTNGRTVKEFQVMRRLVSGKITQLKGRKFFVEPYSIWCNMNKLETSFEPMEGDWISLEASVSVDAHAVDLAGEIMDVISARPSVVQNGTGRVTFWIESKREGIINSTVPFDKSVCDNMYTPSLGDLVCYSALESDQVRFKWRAVWVKPDKMKLKEGIERKLYKNKKGIVITQSSAVIDLKMDETKDVTVEVSNSGTVDRVLLQTKIFSGKSGDEPQLSLKSPSSVDKITLKPADKLQLVVTCTGKKLGSTGELLQFYFENFQIAKSFEINVLPDDYVGQLSNLAIKDSRAKDRKFSKRVSGGNGERNALVWFGSKPFPSLRFPNGNRRENYDVPKWLWRLMLGPGDVAKTSSEALTCLRETVPYLAGNLTPENYVNRFRTLLHLEEIAIRSKFISYAVNEGVLQKRDDFWFLPVSGLADGRPSILVGDKVSLTRPWVTKVTHVGYVHKVECDGISIDFHFEFSLNYGGEKCDVKFVPNTGTFMKCHHALRTAYSMLGKNFFFPSDVVKKPERICFEVAEEPVEETQPKGSMGIGEGKKTLIWHNKSLNERQKMAVVNVMRGHARPMPYVLFGPPGTGKTTTIVEMIIQVYHLIPDSRVLICGPSNSSVDLLTERLIDSGLYKAGELIRLYAVSRIQSIPEKLKPYSDCMGTKTVRAQICIRERKIKGARATLGTFSTIGGLNGFSYEGHSFTHIFIDEAGQMTEPETLIPMCFISKKYTQLVLAGDPLQLGPVCSSFVAAKFDLDRSFLERLISSYPYKANRELFPDTSGFDPHLVTKLTLNYRSLPEIINLPNQLFYDSDLVPLISDKDSFEANLLKKINIRVPRRTSHPAIIFHGVVGRNAQETDSPSWFNLQEISQLVVYLRRIYESGLTADDVGVVTPYSKQVQKCRKVLTEADMAVPKIGTVNNFQGQEKHVIILSTVRSSIESLKNDLMFSLGFVASPRRLNVSLTRARTLLIIIGNPNLLKVDPYWERVISYCIRNRSYVGCTIKGTIKCFGKSIEENEDDSDSESGDSLS